MIYLYIQLFLVNSFMILWMLMFVWLETSQNGSKQETCQTLNTTTWYETVTFANGTILKEKILDKCNVNSRYPPE